MIGEVIAFRDGCERAADKTGILLWKDRFDADWLSLKSSENWKFEPCSREDSNLQGLPHALLRRTRLPVSPREQIERLQSLCCLRL